jgi:hypothetical protein
MQGSWQPACRSALQRDALFDPVEESLDPVAVAVEMGAEVDRIAAIAFWRDIGPCASLHGKPSDPVGVIATVGNHIDPYFKRDKSFPASRLSCASPRR